MSAPSDVDGVLRDAAWRNEKIINGFRIGYCVLMGVPATLFNVYAGRGVPLSNYAFLLWLCIGGAAALVLKRGYHPALSFGLATADIALQQLSLYLFAQQLTPGTTPYMSAMYGIGISGLAMAALSMVRFSVV